MGSFKNQENGVAVCPDEAELMPLAQGEEPEPQLASHLQSCSTCRSRLQRLQSDVAALRQAARSDTPAAPPGMVGRYRIVDVIGRGGQAEVYRAVHPTLRQDVVIKLDQRPAAQLDQSRLAAEARALCELNHPHIARVYDLGTHEGRPFVAMEFIQGRTLAQYASQNRLSPRQAAAILAKVTRALEAAHRLGITHRDVTPRNILMDASEQPRLIDFGLARFERAPAGVRSESFEAPGTVVGTAAFMAPEQLEGHVNEIGPRTDVYAVGEVLRFLVPGPLPRPLSRIIARATAPRPQDRYASAAELARDLEAFAAPPAQRRTLLIAAAASAIALLAWILWPPHHGGNGGGGNAGDNGGQTVAQNQPLTREMILARSRPAVFKIIACGHVTAIAPLCAVAETSGRVRLNYAKTWRETALILDAFLPTTADAVDPQTDGPTIAENEYKRDQAAGTLPRNEDRLTYCYRRIIQDPIRYLEPRFAYGTSERPPINFLPGTPDEERSLQGVPTRKIHVLTESDTPYAEGSGFAVSREGILLTNAHVVGDPTSVPQTALLPALFRTARALEKQLGGPCPPPLRLALARSLMAYLQHMCEIRYARFTDAVVVLNYHESDDAHAKARRDGSAKLWDYLADGPADWAGLVGYPADVLAKGEEFPGKDIAILKLNGNKKTDRWVIGEGGRIRQLTYPWAGLQGFQDKLVCLPLGDSDTFALGGQVMAMGFPGVAVDLQGVKEAASFQVIPQDGSITAREPLTTGWDALHMTAAIDHGHSGGPVVDQQGNVVAINVAGPQSIDGHGLAGYAVAVPINVAREFLAKAGITPDPGPTTAHWVRGLELFDQKRYAEAEKEFDAAFTGHYLTPAGYAGGYGPFSEMAEMVERCRKLAAR